MVTQRHIVALLKAEPGVTEIADINDPDNVCFFNDLPLRSEGEQYDEYEARLSCEQLNRLYEGGLSYDTYSMLVDLGCAIFSNDCPGCENEYMVCLPSSRSDKDLN